MNLKLLKFILFLPLFIACQAGSEILSPDGDDMGGAPDFSCVVSGDNLTFDHAYDYVPSSLSVEIGEETVVVDMSGAPWMEVEGDVTTISPNSTVTLNLVPAEPNYSTEPRSGVVVLKGKYTGKSVPVAVSQAGSYQDEDESLLNGWRLDSDMASSEVWKSEGKLIANKGDLKGLLTLEHSINSNVEISDDEDRGTFTGMRPGDAVLLRAPVKSLTAGTDVSVMINIGHKTAGVKSQWVAEYWDEGCWKEIRKFTTCNDGGEFNYSTFIGDFTLNSQIENDYVKIRFRLVSGDENTLYFVAASPWTGAALEVNSVYPPIADYQKVLILGNSFTFYWSSPFVLKQLARSQGHRLDVRVHTEPGATIAEHINMYSLSGEAVNEGGYHVALMQEVSYLHAKFADGINTAVLTDANELAKAIRLESTTCKVMIENTWAYAEENYKGYGSYSVFDEKLQKGCSDIARSVKAEISPVGQAFARVRESYPDINCIYTDDHHPSRNGAYLKSCVNYLKIYGGEFNDAPYNGEASAENAAVLRQVAYNAVNDVPEEKPREPVTLEMDFDTWPFSPDLAADSKGSVKIKTKDSYTFTQGGVEYPIEIYAPKDGYYYTGSALRFNSSGGGYIKLPALEGRALVQVTVAITNASNKSFYISSDGSDKGDILKNKTVNAQSSATWDLTGTLPNTSYYMYTKATHSQIGKIILTYE